MKKYLLFLTFAFLFGGKSFAAYSGTPKTPSKVDGCYQIGSAEELYGFAEMVNDTTSGFTQDSNTCVKLTADIVVNENVLINDTLNKKDSLIPWIPINVFYGTFDGQVFVNTFCDKIRICSRVSRHTAEFIPVQ